MITRWTIGLQIHKEGGEKNRKWLLGHTESLSFHSTPVKSWKAWTDLSSVDQCTIVHSRECFGFLTTNDNNRTDVIVFAISEMVFAVRSYQYSNENDTARCSLWYLEYQITATKNVNVSMSKRIREKKEQNSM